MNQEIIVVRCPRCNEAHLLHELISGNTIGATFWTDGYFRAPMLPLLPVYVKCGHCGKFSSTSDMERTDEEPEDGMTALSLLSADELRETLTVDDWPQGDEFSLRMELWHESNHPYRDNDNTFEPDDNYRHNILRMIDLLCPEAKLREGHIKAIDPGLFREQEEDALLVISDALRSIEEFKLASEVLALGQYDLEQTAFMVPILRGCITDTGRPIRIGTAEEPLDNLNLN